MDKAILGGYICLTDVPSKPIRYVNGDGSVFFEMIRKGVFTSALKRNHPTLMMNHNRIIAPYENLELWEDNIGLKFRAEVSDIPTLTAAVMNKLTGCSFSFKSARQMSDKYQDAELRIIEELNLFDVSILTKKPIYRSIVEIESIPHSLIMKVEAEIKDRESRPRNAQLMNIYKRIEALKK